MLKFEVTAAMEAHRVTAGRSYYRIASETPALPPEQVQSLKESKRNVGFERQQPFNATWDDLDPSAIAAFTGKINDRATRKSPSASPITCSTPRAPAGAEYGGAPALWQRTQPLAAALRHRLCEIRGQRASLRQRP